MKVIIPLLFLFLLFTPNSTNNSSGRLNHMSNLLNDNLWLDFNFPIVAASDASRVVNQQCLNDTKMQLEALSDALPWAVQS